MLKFPGFFTLILLLFLVSCGQEDQPNLIWITIEDTSPQFIGYEGNSSVFTPHIDRLAREGVRFANAYATAPVCSSSRSTLITGCRTEALGTGNHRSAYPIPQEIQGFPFYLRKRGYYTTNHSKTDYNTSDAGRIIDSAWNDSSNKAGWWNRAMDQKFFSVFNYVSSHQSRTMTQSYGWYVKNVWEKLPDSLRTYPEQIEVPPFYRDSPELRKHLVRVHNSVNLMDWEVGLLIDSLRTNGLLDHTILFFFADHGEAIPRGKTNPTGLGYKVPFFVWFPERYKHLSPWPLGSITEELISFEDLPPTMLSITGASIPDYMTGRAFLGKNRAEPRPYVFLSRNRIDETPDLSRSVSNGRFVYTRVFQPRYPILMYQKYSDVSDIARLIREEKEAGLLNPYQSEMLEARAAEYLYDQHEDPWELHNLAKDPDYQQLLQELQAALRQSILEIRDIHFLPEVELRKINQTGTAYDYRLFADYDIESILNAAWLSGEGQEAIPQLLDLLQASDPVVRYWAAVGLHNQSLFLDAQWDRLEESLSDSYLPAGLEIASVIYDEKASSESKLKLLEGLNHPEGRIVLQALQLIQYLQENKTPFVPAIREVLKHWQTDEAEANDRLDISSCCQVILHFEAGDSLFYPNN